MSQSLQSLEQEIEAMVSSGKYRHFQDIEQESDVNNQYLRINASSQIHLWANDWFFNESDEVVDDPCRFLSQEEIELIEKEGERRLKFLLDFEIEFDS